MIQIKVHNQKRNKLEQKMKIKEICPLDYQIVPPSVLATDICSFTDQPIRPMNKTDHSNGTQANQMTLSIESHSITSSMRHTKKRDQQGLKRLIRQQKVKQLVKRFISKLKLNNVNSKPVMFQPYEVQQRQSVHSIQGIQLPDVYEKILSIFIAFYIMVCLFIDTLASLFPQILNYPMIQIGQYTALIVFLIQFLSSCVVVKMIEGKKVDKITQIITNYVSDGLLIDFAYLIILIVSFFQDVGNLRLIILLKVPECLQRIQRIQNTYVNTFYKEQYWGLAKVFLLNFVLSHFLSLMLILMAQIDPSSSWITKMHFQNCPWYEQYTWGYYWGTTIMLTVGFGDITPGNYKEAICVVIVETFSCLALAYNINCVGNLISNIKSQDIQKNKNIKTFKILSNRNNLTEDLELKIHNYIEESTNIKKKFNFQEESNFISTLPRQLKADFLKESNKKIFESLLFFKNLTQKTMLSFAEVIQMKICHPQEIIKKRGEVAGVMVLKQGKIGLITKLNGSDFNNVTIQTVEINEGQDPTILSLDFLSNDRATYEIKSEEYSILYYLDRDKTIECLKAGELDYEHFCFLRDKSRNFETDFQVFYCNDCRLNHSKFQCPKLHYTPLKKHVIDKHLYSQRISKSKRQDFIRSKTVYNAFIELKNNLKLFEIKSQTVGKYAGYKATNKVIKQLNLILETPKTLNWIRENSSKPVGKSSIKEIEEAQSDLPTEKKIEYQYMAGVLKDQLEKIISNQNEVWLIETDQVRNFKFYFVPYNASTLEYLSRKHKSLSVFS